MTLVGSDADDASATSISEMLALAKLLQEQYPMSTRTVEMLVENYIDCLQSLYDDHRRLGDAS